MSLEPYARRLERIADRLGRGAIEVPIRTIVELDEVEKRVDRLLEKTARLRCDAALYAVRIERVLAQIAEAETALDGE